ncbi:hypothetical protein KPATCC21470_7379 [Kitasatospora purpeofusca]
MRWWSYDGPDEVDNGLCLCSLHHKLFDKGVLGLGEGRRILVSQRFVGRSEASRQHVLALAGRPVIGPRRGFVRSRAGTGSGTPNRSSRENPRTSESSAYRLIKRCPIADFSALTARRPIPACTACSQAHRRFTSCLLWSQLVGTADQAVDIGGGGIVECEQYGLPIGRRAAMAPIGRLMFRYGASLLSPGSPLSPFLEQGIEHAAVVENSSSASALLRLYRRMSSSASIAKKSARPQCARGAEGLDGPPSAEFVHLCFLSTLPSRAA